MKNINLQWLEENNACQQGKDWFINKSSMPIRRLLLGLLQDKKFEWANWLMIKLFTRRQTVLFACYTTRLSLKIFKQIYPQDKRPYKAIQAAEKWANNPTEKNRMAAESIAQLVESVVWAAARDAMCDAARAAAKTAWAVARTAGDAAAGVEAAVEIADWAAVLAAWAAKLAAGVEAADVAQMKILKYGIKLLEKGDK